MHIRGAVWSRYLDRFGVCLRSVHESASSHDHARAPRAAPGAVSLCGVCAIELTSRGTLGR